MMGDRIIGIFALNARRSKMVIESSWKTLQLGLLILGNMAVWGFIFFIVSHAVVGVFKSISRLIEKRKAEKEYEEWAKTPEAQEMIKQQEAVKQELLNRFSKLFSGLPTKPN